MDRDAPALQAEVTVLLQSQCMIKKRSLPVYTTMDTLYTLDSVIEILITHEKD